MIKSVSVYESNIFSVRYESVVCEPKKDQIKGDALVYLLKFIEDCFLEERIKANKLRDSIWLRQYHKNGGKLKDEH